MKVVILAGGIGTRLREETEYQKMLDERKVCYCLVEQIDGGKDKKVIREVTYSSCNKEALGLVF